MAWKDTASVSRSRNLKTKALGNLITRPESADYRFNCLNSAQIDEVTPLGFLHHLLHVATQIRETVLKNVGILNNLH